MHPNLPTVLHVARNHQVSVATVDNKTRISITPNFQFDTAPAVRHTAQQRSFKAPKTSGNRTRQTSGFFAPEHCQVNGREGPGAKYPQGEYRPPNLSWALNLPATIAGAFQSAPTMTSSLDKEQQP